MKIGKFVQRAIPAISDDCETRDPTEFGRLQDERFPKETFDINDPFCRAVAKIGQTDRVRFRSREHTVPGIPVPVTSQWFNPPASKSLALFRRYLAKREIPFDEGIGALPDAAGDAPAEPVTRAPRGRYKGHAAGNARNGLVRNILSRPSDEQSGAPEWEAVVADFATSCACCGAGGDLVTDHVVPINKPALGKHRPGNPVPACRACNAKTAGQDFREFLAGDPARIAIAAIMRKLVILANALIRDDRKWTETAP